MGLPRPTFFALPLAFMASLTTLAAPPPYADKQPQKYDVTRWASEFDPRAKDHPEVDFRFADAKGKSLDVQHAVVDTRVPPQGRLVIWLMGHSPASPTGWRATACTTSRSSTRTSDSAWCRRIN